MEPNQNHGVANDSENGSGENSDNVCGDNGPFDVSMPFAHVPMPLAQFSNVGNVNVVINVGRPNDHDEERPCFAHVYASSLPRNKREPRQERSRTLPPSLMRKPVHFVRTSNDPKDWSAWIDNDSARPEWLRQAFVELKLVDEPAWLQRAHHYWNVGKKECGRWKYELSAWREYLGKQLGGDKEANAVIWVQSGEDSAYSSAEEEESHSHEEKRQEKRQHCGAEKREDCGAATASRRSLRRTLGEEQIKELYQPNKSYAPDNSSDSSTDD